MLDDLGTKGERKSVKATQCISTNARLNTANLADHKDPTFCRSIEASL